MAQTHDYDHLPPTIREAFADLSAAKEMIHEYFRKSQVHKDMEEVVELVAGEHENIESFYHELYDYLGYDGTERFIDQLYKLFHEHGCHQ